MEDPQFFHSISNPAFQDGNKRTGVHAALAFLGMNGVDLFLPTDEGERVALAVAKHEMQKDAIIEYFTRLMEQKD